MGIKLRGISKKTTYWLSIAIVGAVIGLGVQFARAVWSDPTVGAPNGSVTAPILTSGDQIKNGKLTVSNLEIPVGGTITLGGVPRSTWPEGGTTTTTTVTPAPAPSSGFMSGEWFNDKLGVYSDYNIGGQRSWAPEQVSTMVAGHDINRLRLRGGADDGGYCYVYWGSGHLLAMRHDYKSGVYNMDNQVYPRELTPTKSYTYVKPALIDGDTGNYYCQTGYELYNKQSCGTVSYTCPAGTTQHKILDGEYFNSGYESCTQPCPFSVDDKSNIKICQQTYGAGAMLTQDVAVNIPKGTTIALKGQHVQGDDADLINCAVDVQYAP